MMVRQTDNVLHHLETPSVSLHEHVASAKCALKQDLDCKRIIYLDTNFLLQLRDHKLERLGQLPKNFDRFYKLLLQGLEAEKLICPISEHLVVEVLRQSDDSSRVDTLNVLSKFSKDIGFVNTEEVQFLELSMLLCRNSTAPIDVYPRANVWTKAPYCFGEVYPNSERVHLDSDTRLATQKKFFDHLWETSLVDFIGHYRPNFDDEKPFLDGLASRITDQNAIHSGELNSFNQAFKAECTGVADAFSEVFDAVVRSTQTDTTKDLQLLIQHNKIWYERVKVAIISASLQKTNGYDKIPSAFIATSLHAARRWNKGQVVKANDFTDYDHAALALPYCDAFFTERSLTTAIKQNHTALDYKFGCFVTYNVSEAIEYLEKI